LQITFLKKGAKAIFRYVNGDLNKCSLFRFAVSERVKPFADNSWMPWGLEIVSAEIMHAHSNWMEDNAHNLPQSFGRYNIGYVDVHANMVIETMLDDYFKQRYLYGCGDRK